MERQTISADASDLPQIFPCMFKAGRGRGRRSVWNFFADKSKALKNIHLLLDQPRPEIFNNFLF